MVQNRHLGGIYQSLHTMSPLHMHRWVVHEVGHNVPCHHHGRKQFLFLFDLDFTAARAADARGTIATVSDL